MTMVILVAVFVEAIVEWVKDIARSEFMWTKILGYVVGLIILYLLDLDIFIILGLEPAVPFLGTVILAFIVGRGANYAHDILERINLWRKTVSST